MILCTQEAEKFLIEKNNVYNPENIEIFVEKIKKNNPSEVIIYDKTKLSSPNEQKIYIPVNDHVNRTGQNPLIGKQKYFNLDFIDIKKLYKWKTGGITTFSCGKNLNMKLPFPSHFLCHIGIICKALKIKSIKAFLINSEHSQIIDIRK